MRTSTIAYLLTPLALAGCTLAACTRAARVTASHEPEGTLTATATAVPSSAPAPKDESGRADAPAPLAPMAEAPAPVPVPMLAAPAAPKYATGLPMAKGAPERSASDGVRAVAPRPADLPFDGRAADALGGAASAAPSPALRAFSPPAASIAAGEWNDNANYHEFQKWLATEASLPFPHVNVSHRRFLVVRDEEGRAVPGCRIDVSDAQQRHVTLTTGPSGRALFFPRAEGLGGALTTATADCSGAHVTRAVSLAEADGVVNLRLPTLRQLSDQRTIDVAFILDTTGSMSEEIASVKATIAKVAAGLGDGNVAVRIGLVEFKDRGDAFVTRVHPFSTDVKGFAASVAGLSAGGGGDTPESVNEGIHVALTGLDWRGDSVGRFAFLVGDAPPHLDYAQDFSYAADMKTAAHRGIQIFTIAASGMDPVGQVVWRQIAQYTNAANMFVLRGGAGPQSVGGGDPRSSCGGTQQSYTSGHLDALILGKINGELRALDGDPMRIAGLNEDENVKPCDQRVVMK